MPCIPDHVTFMRRNLVYVIVEDQVVPGDASASCVEP